MTLQAILYALAAILAVLAAFRPHPSLLPLSVAAIAAGLLITPLANLV